MFNTEQIIGDIVFISFNDINRYQDIGLSKPYGHFFILGYDNIGVWVTHPGLFIEELEDKKGKPLPLEKIHREEINASFLVTWDNIKTIMHYPNREGFDFPSEFDKNIGFKFKRNKQ
tara:strand:+ start:189 stop:539 length:351 start_codon:yes stop_codon:yes gene_type:complete